MNLSLIVTGVVILIVLALAVLVALTMAGRQQTALKLDHKPVPEKWKIIIAGLITALAFVSAVAFAMLMLFVPFINLNLTGSVDSTSNLLTWLVIGLGVLGIFLYWFFVKLGLFSWKTISLDN